MELPRRSSLRKSATFLLYLSFCAFWWAAESSTDDNDVNALWALQDAWGVNAVSTLQWAGNDPCGSDWTGIKCDNSAPQRVISISLPGLGFAGELPSDIGLLSALSTLDLSFNNLTGSIPSQIGQLTQLTQLVLQFNYFNGKIPNTIGQLKNLTTLSLNGNFLYGPIPHEIGLLTNLYWLDLAQNQLQGQLPYSSDGQSNVHAGLDNLTNAGHFHLNNNSFSGPIPESICHSGMHLIHLLVDSNSLSGSIPGGLGSCGYLQILKLSNNLLNGTIPAQIAQLTNLTELQVGGNQLAGPLPDLTNLTNLVLLDLSDNPLHVEFPSWMSSLQSLTDLDMQNASVSGQIPPSFFGLQGLNQVNLANNGINGTLNLSLATSQLLLVSVQNNSISSLYPNQIIYNTVLQLQGNPACNPNSTSLSSKVCSDNSFAPPPATHGMNTTACSITCPSGYQVSPVQCDCAVPYQGILIFRAPLFTSLINTSRIPTLVEALAKGLLVDQNQVQVISATFNDQLMLIVDIAIYPNSSMTKWSLDDVLRMASVLEGLSPPGFGPPMFHQTSYGYSGPIKLGGSSQLSVVAKIGIGVGAGVLLLVILGLVFFACLQKRCADEVVELTRPFGTRGSLGKDSGGAPQLKGARAFTYSELKKATNNFSESNEIGSGGYGKVYKGIIASGEQIAIKRAQAISMQGAQEFKTEIELLSGVHHKNVVRLVGFCFEQREQMLVYEYMAGGSLRDCLLGRSGVKLDWRRRIMIALGAARGIAYLHELVNPPIIHRDIKSTNILLDEKKIAKVADFGLSKIGPGEGSEKQHVSTQVKGTLGYLDPEYYISQQLSEKSDVYSFGVVLLELLTCRAPIEHGKYVVKEVKMAIDKGGLGTLHPMLDPRLRDEELAELNAFVRIALSCVEDSAASRPSMGEIVKQLEELVGHDYPESGSSNMDLPKRTKFRNSYGSEFDSLPMTSRESSNPNSTSDILRSFGSGI